MRKSLIGALLLLPSLALAQQPPVATAPLPTFNVAMTGQDASNLNQVCNFAMGDAALNLQTKTGVGQFCLDLLNRMQQASSAPPPVAKKEDKAPQGAPIEEPAK